MDPKEFDSILKDIKENKINQLDLSNKPLTSIQITQLCEALKNNNSLLQLNLENTRINGVNLASLFWALVENKTLQDLNLSHNGISGGGIAPLRSLIADSSLQVLRLEGNLIKPEDHAAIKDDLKKNLARIKKPSLVTDHGNTSSKSDHKDWKTIKIEGDGTCGLHCVAVGLIENIHNGKLEIKSELHSEFLTHFGQKILRLNDGISATPQQVQEWVKKNYISRYNLSTYSELSTEVLRGLLGGRVREQWNSTLLPKIIAKLNVLYQNSTDEKTTSSTTEQKATREKAFQAMLNASELKIGDFGKKLIQIVEDTKEQKWEVRQETLNTNLKENKMRDLYIEEVINKEWVSKDLDLPLLGKYFGMNLFITSTDGTKENITPISESKAEAHLVYNGHHFDYNMRSSELTSNRNNQSSAMDESDDESLEFDGDRYAEADYTRPPLLSTGLAGTSYQTKILMLYAFDAYSSGKCFDLMSEASEYEKFDDMVLFTWNRKKDKEAKEESKLTVLQAKHSYNPKGKYTLEHLLVESKAKSKKAALFLYFNSWLAIEKRKKAEPEKYPGAIQYVFYTNHQLPLELKDIFIEDKFDIDFIEGKKFHEDPHIAEEQMKTRARMINSIYRNWSKYQKAYNENEEKHKKTLSEHSKDISIDISAYDEKICSEIIVNMKEFFKLAKNKSKIKLDVRKQDLVFLFWGCIEKKNGSSAYQFKEDFINGNNLAPYHLKIRQQLSGIKNLKEITLEISKNALEPPSQPGSKYKTLLPKLVQFSAANFNQNRINLRLTEPENIEDDADKEAIEKYAVWLAGAYGNQSFDAQLKDESSLLFNYGEIISEAVKNHQDLAFDYSKTIDKLDDEIINFFKQFSLLNKQPNETELTKTLQEKISAKFRMSDSSYYHRFYVYMLDELKKRQTHPFNEKEMKKLFSDAKANLNRQHLAGGGIRYMDKITKDNYSLEVEQKNIDDIVNFIKKSSNNLLFIKGPVGSGKTFAVCRAMKAADLNQDNYSFLDVAFSSGLLPEDGIGFSEDGFELLGLDNADILFESEHISTLTNLIKQAVKGNKKLILVLNKVKDINQYISEFLKSSNIKHQEQEILSLSAENLTKILAEQKVSEKYISVGGRNVQLQDILLNPSSGFYKMLSRPRFLKDIVDKSFDLPKHKIIPDDSKQKENAQEEEVFIDPRLSSYQPIYDFGSILQASQLNRLLIQATEEKEEKEEKAKSSKLLTLIRGHAPKEKLIEIDLDALQTSEEKEVLIDFNNIQNIIAKFRPDLLGTRDNCILLIYGSHYKVWENLKAEIKKSLLKYPGKCWLILRGHKQSIQPFTTVQLLSPIQAMISDNIEYDHLPLPTSFLTPQKDDGNPFGWKELLDPSKFSQHCPFLISSEAGSGKSTLTQRLAKTWQLPNNKQSWQWIIKIDLRNLDFKDFEYLPQKFIQNQLRQQFPKEEWPRWKELMLAMDVDGKRVLLLLDGWDEIKGAERREACAKWLQKMQQESIPMGITTRPGHIDSIPIMPRKRLILEEFNPPQINDYIEQSFIKSSPFANKVKKWLTYKNQALMKVIGIPLQCYLLCETLKPFYQESLKKDDQSIDWPWGEDEEISQSRLYQQFTLAKLQIFWSKHQGMHAAKTSSMPRIYAISQSHLRYFEKIACKQILEEGLKLDTIVDIEEWLEEDFKDLGLEINMMADGKRQYHFIHKTYLEYFAALYLLRALLTEKQGRSYLQALKFIQRYRFQARYQVVYQFIKELSLQGDPLLPKFSDSHQLIKLGFLDPPDLIGVSGQKLGLKLRLIEGKEPAKRLKIEAFIQDESKEDFSTSFVRSHDSSSAGIDTGEEKKLEELEPEDFNFLKKNYKHDCLFKTGGTGWQIKADIFDKIKLIPNSIQKFGEVDCLKLLDHLADSSSFLVKEKVGECLEHFDLQKSIHIIKKLFKYSGKGWQQVCLVACKILLIKDANGLLISELGIPAQEVVEKLIDIANEVPTFRMQNMGGNTTTQRTRYQTEANDLLCSISVDNKEAMRTLAQNFPKITWEETQICVLNKLASASKAEQLTLNLYQLFISVIKNISNQSVTLFCALRIIYDQYLESHCENIIQELVGVLKLIKDKPALKFYQSTLEMLVATFEGDLTRRYETIKQFVDNLEDNRFDFFNDQLEFIAEHQGLYQKVVSKLAEKFKNLVDSIQFGYDRKLAIYYLSKLEKLAETNLPWPEATQQLISCCYPVKNEAQQLVNLLLKKSILTETHLENFYQKSPGGYWDIDAGLPIVGILRAKLNFDAAQYFIKHIEAGGSDSQVFSATDQSLVELYKSHNKMSVEAKFYYLIMCQAFIRKNWPKNLYQSSTFAQQGADFINTWIKVAWECYSETYDLAVINALFDFCFIYGLPLVRITETSFIVTMLDKEIELVGSDQVLSEAVTRFTLLKNEAARTNFNVLPELGKPALKKLEAQKILTKSVEKAEVKSVVSEASDLKQESGHKRKREDEEPIAAKDSKQIDDQDTETQDSNFIEKANEPLKKKARKEGQSDDLAAASAVPISILKGQGSVLLGGVSIIDSPTLFSTAKRRKVGESKDTSRAVSEGAHVAETSKGDAAAQSQSTPSVLITNRKRKHDDLVASPESSSEVTSSGAGSASSADLLLSTSSGGKRF